MSEPKINLEKAQELMVGKPVELDGKSGTVTKVSHPKRPTILLTKTKIEMRPTFDIEITFKDNSRQVIKNVEVTASSAAGE